MLREAGIGAEPCASLPALIGELDRGAAFVVVTEEVLATSDLHPLSAWIEAQEKWSDLPFVLLTRRGGGLERNPAAVRYLEVLGNVTFLERPFHPTTLISLVKSALRGRLRQYEARSRLHELRESEERYRTLFNSMDEGFCIIEFIDGPEGSCSDYIHLQANSAYERHTGIPNVVGQKVRAMVGDEAQGWIDLYAEVLRTGQPIRFERELVVTGRFLELAAFRVEPASRRQVAVLFQDVTARKQAELALRELNETLENRVAEAIAERETALAQLHEAQKLETIGQLTGGVAHDFNNLLTPITGALDLLNLRQTGDDPRMARLIDGALQSAERAKTLVQRLLGFARRQALETRAIDLVDLIDNMRDLIASSIGTAIELRIAHPGDLPPTQVDPNQLELAILNLCVNARDAMPRGGVLTIALEPAIVGPRFEPRLAPGAYVRLSVIDTGCGMDEATLARAIEPFYSTKEVGRGTGLGLSMVHGLAAQLSGAFVLTSSPGEGTRADLYLPVAELGTQPTANRIETGAAQYGRPLSILLVDDEDLVRAGTAEMLRQLGHSVVEIGSGAEALKLLKDQQGFDILVTDYMMPHMDGATLARQAQDIAPHLPVLVVTGYAGGDLQLGLPQLAKPYRQSDLAAMVRKIADRATNVVPLTKKMR
jgi:PAS domain S-box-containing protein